MVENTSEGPPASEQVLDFSLDQSPDNHQARPGRASKKPDAGPNARSRTTANKVNKTSIADASGTNERTGKRPERPTRSAGNEPQESDWKNQSIEDRKRYLTQIQLDYFSIVDDYLAYANLCVKKYNWLSDFHGLWRKWTIIGTGGLAGLNALAAFELVGKVDVTKSIRLASILSAIAAIYAVGLTIAGNLENFFNAGEKAAGFRESRELFLSRYREHLYKWVHFVESFGFSEKACINAGRIYYELVEGDKDLRSKVKDLTEVMARGGGDTNGKHS
jgi:hypothetical protein